MDRINNWLNDKLLHCGREIGKTRIAVRIPTEAIRQRSGV